MDTFPSTTVSRTINGDRNYALQFRGEADRLLYQLKNLMSFRDLGQLRMVRNFTDGTVITAWSFKNEITKVYQDFINIDVSKSVVTGLAIASCTITFIDFPLSVPPMADPDIIKPSDIQGVNYFKTYYFVDIVNCPTCQDIAWEFTFTYATPEESRHWSGESDNHTVYSLDPPASAELIQSGKDSLGTFIIWKAHTESLTMSKTGLAIMLINSSISKSNGDVLCTQQQKIDVDCCKKSLDQRNVEIWWAYEGSSGGSWIIEGGTQLWKMVDPTNVSVFIEQAGWGHKGLYALPHELGGCIPYKWALSGMQGEVVPSDFYGTTAQYIAPLELSGVCNQLGLLTVQDRCGTEYKVQMQDCCNVSPELAINYTSLQLECGDGQLLGAVGGCPPYTWSMSGGGGFDGSPTGPKSSTGPIVDYASPLSNPSCADNATITLTDCCGNSVSIGLAINCVDGGGLPAFYVIHFIYSAGANCSSVCFAPGKPNCEGAKTHISYRCDGTFYDETGVLAMKHKIPSCAVSVPCSSEPDPCGNYPGPYYNETTCAEENEGQACGQTFDIRTAAQIAAGCCPSNPETGLPF